MTVRDDIPVMIEWMPPRQGGRPHPRGPIYAVTLRLANDPEPTWISVLLERVNGLGLADAWRLRFLFPEKEQDVIARIAQGIPFEVHNGPHVIAHGVSQSAPVNGTQHGASVAPTAI